MLSNFVNCVLVTQTKETHIVFQSPGFRISFLGAVITFGFLFIPLLENEATLRSSPGIRESAWWPEHDSDRPQPLLVCKQT